MVSSFVNMIVFAHFAIAASEQVALTQNKALKSVTTALVKLLQLLQCVLCIGHAGYALAWVNADQIPKEVSCLQVRKPNRTRFNRYPSG